jgi:(S)-ureidoglycine aminohydrolase
MGARFAQSTWFFEANGSASFPKNDEEYVLYVQEGGLKVTCGKEFEALNAGSFAYVPPHEIFEMRAAKAGAKVILFQKKYAPLAGSKAPGFLIGHTGKVTGQPFLGNPRALLQILLPDAPAFDLAVNIFTYQPGATLPFVETHIMEHGLLMLSGQGIYRLEDDWYPVTAGDVIWMAPYCPQWFVAMGDEPASYLYYKDVNRPLLAP